MAWYLADQIQAARKKTLAFALCDLSCSCALGRGYARVRCAEHSGQGCGLRGRHARTETTEKGLEGDKLARAYRVRRWENVHVHRAQCLVLGANVSVRRTLTLSVPLMMHSISQHSAFVTQACRL